MQFNEEQNRNVLTLGWSAEEELMIATIQQTESVPPHLWENYPLGAGETWALPRRLCRTRHVHRTYISSVELGKVNVGIEVANALAAALGLGLSELVRRAE
jgi:transcriptional regulator with XRE-family HTH domain